MSGPKCGTVEVDWDSLRETEAREAEELRRLEAQRERDEAQQARLARLREREARRQVREEERRRRAAEQAEAQRKQALEAYNQVRAQLEMALQRRDEIEGRFPGIRLPGRPVIDALPASNDLAAIGAATARLRVQAREYQRAQDEALLRYQQEAAALNATAEMQAWLAQFRKRAIRTASDVIVALESNALVCGQRDREARLKAYAVEAKRLIECLGREETELPDALLGRLDEVFISVRDDQGQTALALLRQEVGAELSRREEDKGRSESERLAAEERNRRTRVADEICGVLEDMGYSVSGVDETVFAQDGQLYAWNKEWPEHVVRVELGAGGREITAAPLRIDEKGQQDTGTADAQQDKEADADFDAAWCEQQDGGIKEFKKRLKERKIGFRYTKAHKPGDLELGTVAEAGLGRRIQTARSLGQQTHPGKAKAKKHPGGNS